MKIDWLTVFVVSLTLFFFYLLVIEPMVKKKKIRKLEQEKKALREMNQPIPQQAYFFENEPDLEFVVTEVNKDEGSVSGNLIFHLPVGVNVIDFDQTKLRKIQVYYSLTVDQASIDYPALFNAKDKIIGLDGWDVWYNTPYVVKKDKPLK